MASINNIHKSPLSFGAFLCFVVAFSEGSIWDDPCQQQSIVSLFDDKDHLATLDLNKICENGTVDWHYPQGSLHLSLDKGVNSRFTFCMVMVESWVTYHGGFTDLTDGRNVKMAMPSTDHPSCIKSSHGKILVSVAALPDQYYMTSMKYTVTVNHQ